LVKDGLGIEMSKCLLMIVLLALYINMCFAIIIQIGTGNILNVCLPIEPTVNYSYSQSIYTAAEIGTGGSISAISWQYRINSNIFLPNNNQFSIYMGTVNRDRYFSATDWVPLDSLQLVFQGDLQQSWFSSVLPGQGWLTIPLDTLYNYSGTGNLVIAVDENMAGYSSNGDDFYCFSSANLNSIEYHSMPTDPDPAAPPPAYNGNPMSVRPNIKINIHPVIYTPHTPVPNSGSIDVSLTPALSWMSDADSWDVYFSQVNQPLQLVASNLTDPVWTPANNLSLFTTYQWKVISYTGSDIYPGIIWTFTTAGEALSAPLNLQATTIGLQVQLQWQPPAQGTIVSYRIYRNQQFLEECLDTSYLDAGVLPNQTYWYYVQAVNYLNQVSLPSNSVSATIPGSLPVWQMSFEEATDFTASIAGWTMYDLDNANTWPFNFTDFPNEGFPLSWIVFNPLQTTPPLTTITPYSGQKMMLSISSLNPPNNDWLISPQINVQSGYAISFWVRSITADYGLERLRFLISTTNNAVSSFLPLSTEPWLLIPATWTQISFDLSQYAGQQVYFAWNCVSWDALALCLDEIVITQALSNEDNNCPPVVNALIYPNPAKDWFTIVSEDKSLFDLNIYNLKGQKVASVKQMSSYTWQKDKDAPLKSGLYILKVKSRHHTKTYKLLIR